MPPACLCNYLVSTPKLDLLAISADLAGIARITLSGPRNSTHTTLPASLPLHSLSPAQRDDTPIGDGLQVHYEQGMRHACHVDG